jgi:thiol-disulfide isomerase/thioredoxin
VISARSTRFTLLVVATIALALGAGCLRLPPLPEDPLPAVRDLIAKKDFDAAEALLTSYQTERGTTPALVDGLSVLAQGLNAAGERPRAEGIARTTYELATKLLMARPVDEEPRAPLALGRAIEIWAQAAARRGDTHGAMALLTGELETYRGTSVEKRIQRNIHLLQLKGQVAPPLDLSEHLGVASPPLDRLKGRVVVMFFWAHYCADCKAQAPVLARIAEKYRSENLAIVAPTQRYGYVAEGKDAEPTEETRYIDEVRRIYYPVLADAPIPLSDANHRRYGVSSTPTIVLLDRSGRVALYHPGTMTEAELDRELQPLLRSDARQS